MDVPTQSRTLDFGFLPQSKRVRYDPENPPVFGLGMQLTFSAATTLGNVFARGLLSLLVLNTCIVQLSKSFDTDYSNVALVPTMVSAGYGTGILLITPLGDLVRRRQLVLILTLVCTCCTIPLSITHNIAVFQAFHFLVGVSCVIPQILIPLAADLTTGAQQALTLTLLYAAISCGNLLGRVIAGIIAEFTHWRVVYYVAIGIQASIFLTLYFFVPEYPAKRHEKSLGYLQILWSIARFVVTEPVLVQCCLICFISSAASSNFILTLTFLLGDIFHWSTLAIGLFGLIGVISIMASPLVGKAMGKIVPWYATLLSTLGTAVFQAIQCGAGGLNIAPVVLTMIGVDFFRPILLVSLSSRIFKIDPAARSRLNALFILSLFCGSVAGSYGGTVTYVKHGWRVGAALSLAFAALQLCTLLLRGPECQPKTWIGWQGGAGAFLQKHDTENTTRDDSDSQQEGSVKRDGLAASEKCRSV
ncbi:MFS general substrate transporter [Cylindrobasidium torrendii FP15055 ss-10]|uniref:MFS general substrate transporter n=1 Tax=Cylindrobasidium torrendii FP15055 ss-10 TaxID=1314674 RepID=A0A0D7BB33_9AGAR|nr:MFS general substrate transporter [Cylindrobasidium torrendii FP15055 ss-10]